MVATPWADWRQRFKARTGRPLPEVQSPGLSGQQRRRLARSLAIFELGESGEGRIATEIRFVDRAGIDGMYREALGLFVAEEARHGRILTKLVRTLGGQPLPGAWTNTAFTAGRRLAGVRLKLLVLMAAEVVGISFYTVIQQPLGAGSFRSALEEICGDELDHLDFHADFFHTQINGPLDAAIFSVGWSVVSWLSTATVAIDHHRTLAALGIRQQHYWREACLHADRARRRVRR